MVDIQEILVKNLKKHRKRLKWTQSKLAEECDVTLNFIGKIESKLTFPSNDTLNKIIAALKIHPYELFLDQEKNEGVQTVKEYERIADHVIQLIQSDVERARSEGKLK